MLKKIIFFILIILLLSLLFFTSCIFYGPCKTKIMNYIPDSYKQYLEFNINGEKNNKQIEVEKEKKDLLSIDISDNAGNEEVEFEENIIETNSDITDKEKEIQENIEENNKIEEELKEKLKKEENNEEKIMNKGNDSSENSIEKNNQDEIRKKIKQRLEEKKSNKGKIIEEGSESDIKNNNDEKELKKKTFVTYINGEKKVLELNKFLGNGVYYANDGNIYLDNKKIKKVDDIEKFNIKKIGEDIALLEEKKGYSRELYLIDIDKKNFYKVFDKSRLSIEKAEKINNKIVFLIKSNYVEGGIFIFDIEDKKLKKIFSNSDTDIKKESFSYKRIRDFNLFSGNLGNSLIEVLYRGQNGEEMKKIIGTLK